MRRSFFLPAVLAVLAVVAALVGACQGAGQSRTVPLATLNDSGVTGTVALTEQSDGRTRVEIQVTDGGNRDMPAHIHPGTCAELVPQPKYPLENVRNGHSVTIVPAPFRELATEALAVNLHRSVDDLASYTACADLGPGSGGAPSGSAAAADVVVETAPGADLRFMPDAPMVASMTSFSLLFRNTSSVAHNLTFSNLDARTETIVQPGAVEAIPVTVPGPGAYPFVCTIHPGMAGTLMVH